MAFSVRGGQTSRTPFSHREIGANISDMKMGSWISSLLRETLEGADFADNDFMGQSGDIVSIADLTEAMAYYATLMGYSASWESSPSPTFDNFERRPGIYQTLLKKVDNWSTLSGGRKLSSVKKVIRIRVGDKTNKMCAKPNPLGVFVGSGKDMANIYTETNHKTIVYKLHRLGKYPEEDPRFYIHMVYRYYMNEFHKTLAADGKVLRFPSMQKIMDIMEPMDCVESTPPEFRMFLQNARGNTVNAVTLPVPSRTTTNEVVYGYNFESAVPWVPVVRAMIFDMFTDLNARDSSNTFRQFYPKYLIKGDGGCETGKKAVVEALARSIEMKDLVEVLDSVQSISQEAMELLDNTLSVDSRVAGVFPRYTSHPFLGEGEQLQERVGFLLQDSVRGVFRRISSKTSSFYNDIYSSLRVPFVTMEVFKEYCTTKTFMTYKRRDDKVWRSFIIDMKKICCVFHAWSRRSDVNQFVEENGSVDGYLSRVLEKLETESGQFFNC